LLLSEDNREKREKERAGSYRSALSLI
jgi:hypothetical protein